MQLESEEAKNEASLKEIEVLKAKLAQMKEDIVNKKAASPEAGRSEEYSSQEIEVEGSHNSDEDKINDSTEVIETDEVIEMVQGIDSNDMIIDDGEILIACEQTF